MDFAFFFVYCCNFPNILQWPNLFSKKDALQQLCTIYRFVTYKPSNRNAKNTL